MGSKSFSLPGSSFEKRQLLNTGSQLTLDMDKLKIVRVMACKEGGLEIKDRKWLNIIIPNAFLGNNLVTKKIFFH